MEKLIDEEILDVILSKKLQDRFSKRIDKSAGDDKCWIRKNKPGNPAQKNKYWSFNIKGKRGWTLILFR